MIYFRTPSGHRTQNSFHKSSSFNFQWFRDDIRIFFSIPIRNLACRVPKKKKNKKETQTHRQTTSKHTLNQTTMYRVQLRKTKQQIYSVLASVKIEWGSNKRTIRATSVYKYTPPVIIRDSLINRHRDGWLMN